MTLTSKDRAALITLEEALWRAETRFDPVLMDQTFSSDFVEFGRSGRRYERAEMLFDPDQKAEIRALLPLPDYSVELVAADVALATYTSEVRYGDEIQVGRRSSLWVKNGGCWQLRFHQGTPC
ncbi:nuclear transport factor 2 family protein [Pacificibacter sp. AS14]|uniref:nuclear transport factor 2 family protein n=1 Tax=Pacificibacter sp. AS14 TaxID=3135785 RepID=UPI00316F1606